jgi:hypothetical protein
MGRRPWSASSVGVLTSGIRPPCSSDRHGILHIRSPLGSWFRIRATGSRRNVAAGVCGRRARWLGRLNRRSAKRALRIANRRST